METYAACIASGFSVLPQRTSLRTSPPCVLTLSPYTAGNHRPDDANGVITAGLVDIIEAPYSILDQRAAELLFPLAEQQHVSIIARTPLASGALAGSWYEGMKFHRDDWRRRVFRGDLLRQTVQRVAEVQSLVESTAPLA
jgi:aryl-alcohol dehydrogenase-like predicted oxidoreductase